MYINLNATLIIQAINFFLAYLIFRFFLLKPAIKSIQYEQDSQEQLRHSIEHAQQQLSQKEQERRMKWQQNLNYFQVHMPSLSNRYFVIPPEIPVLEYHPLNQKDVQDLVKTASNALVQKVMHG